ncbi:hypothetical protein PG989_004579 [Apiospora arundinis]
MHIPLRYDATTLRRHDELDPKARKVAFKIKDGDNKDDNKEYGDNKPVRANVSASRNRIQDRPTQRTRSS